MMPVSSHGPEPIIVEIEGLGELEFPGDTDPSVIQAKVLELTAPKEIAPPEPPKGFNAMPGGRSSGGYDVRKSDKWAQENAPAIGATLAGVATGGASIPLAISAAGLGGAAGSGLRGDDAGTMIAEGAKQGALTAAGAGVSKLLAGPARMLYRAAVPKAIQDKFAQSDLARQGLDSRVLLGTKRGATRAGEVSAAAGRDIATKSSTVAPMSARKIQEAFQPKYQKAFAGRKFDRANEINAHVAKSMDEIGQGSLSGPQQLARKEFLEQEGKAAMGAANPNMAAVNPQLANIERKALVRNLRTSKPMAKALDTSQAAIGVDRAAKATQNSSLVNRLAHGGIWNAARSPAGLSGTAIGMNELSNIPFAQLLRMAQISQLQDEE